MNLNERFQKALADAKAALEAGNLEDAQKFRQEAESVKALIDEAASLGSLEKSYQPMRPNLPGTQQASAIVSDVVTPAADQNVKTFDSRGAAYQTRFGDTPSMVKQVLTELHGSDFEGAYWAQKNAFRRYIRLGEQSLTNEHRKAMGDIVFTPAAVKMAFSQGVEDINSFKLTMIEAADTLGGYMVPVDFQMRILERIAGLSTIRQRASTMTTSRDRVELPEATGASGKYTSPVRVTWVDETPVVGQLAENYLTFGLRGIPVHTVMAESPLSRNLIEDSSFDIEGYLAKKLSESAAIDENRQFAVGNGVGKPLGLLPEGTNSNAFSSVHTGSSSTLTADGLIKVPFGIDAQYRNQGSVWMMNKNTLQTIAVLKDGNGNYFVQPYHYEGAGQNPIGHSLLGYPIVEEEDMPDIASGSFPILFGDLSAYQVVDRLGMTVERYLDSQTARQNLIYYVMRRRLGGQPLETWKLLVHEVAS